MVVYPSGKREMSSQLKSAQVSSSQLKVPVRQVRDEVVRVGGRGGGLDVSMRHVRPGAVRDVLADRDGEERRLLRQPRDELAQGLLCGGAGREQSRSDTAEAAHTERSGRAGAREQDANAGHGGGVGNSGS
jgi:hypothetical protein